MSKLGEKLADTIIKYCFDEHENGEYRFYLEDINLNGLDYLFVRVDELNDNDVLVYVCNEDDSDPHFIYFDNLFISTKTVILDQTLHKRDEKLNMIKIIQRLHKIGYNISNNMIVPSVKDKIFYEHPENEKYLIVGETSLEYNEDDDEMCLVIWYGEAGDEDCIQCWIPLYELSVKEIETIGASLVMP